MHIVVIVHIPMLPHRKLWTSRWEQLTETRRLDTQESIHSFFFSFCSPNLFVHRRGKHLSFLSANRCQNVSSPFYRWVKSSLNGKPCCFSRLGACVPTRGFSAICPHRDFHCLLVSCIYAGLPSAIGLVAIELYAIMGGTQGRQSVRMIPTFRPHTFCQWCVFNKLRTKFLIPKGKILPFGPHSDNWILTLEKT